MTASVPIGTKDDAYNAGRTARPNLPRTIPAKGTPVGIVGTSGFCHQQFGISATPAVVDSFDARWLYLTDPAGLRKFALHLSDPWELKPAADCHFFTMCHSCQGCGEKHVGEGDPCDTCKGERTINKRTCPDCEGRGRKKGHPGAIISCVECSGWGIHLQQPFTARNVRRAKKAHAKKAASQ